MNVGGGFFVCLFFQFYLQDKIYQLCNVYLKFFSYIFIEYAFSAEQSILLT